jgi:hypothetical protein
VENDLGIVVELDVSGAARAADDTSVATHKKKTKSRTFFASKDLHLRHLDSVTTEPAAYIRHPFANILHPGMLFIICIPVLYI